MSNNQIHVRWMIRGDLSTVVAIDHLSHTNPWCPKELTRCLRQSAMIAMVAEVGSGDDCRVAGWMLYELGKTKFTLHRLCVHFEDRRLGVGRAMVEKLKAKLSPGKRRKIVAEVDGDNIDACVFLRQCGFTFCGRIPGREALLHVYDCAGTNDIEDEIEKIRRAT